MARPTDARELLDAAVDALAAAPVWSSETRLRGVPVWEAVVRPSVEFMRWPEESGAPGAVVFRDGVAYLHGAFWHRAMLGYSCTADAAVDSVLAGKWISCDGTRFRRSERDHSPLGMLLKSVVPAVHAEVTVQPAKATGTLLVQVHESSRGTSAMIAPDPVVGPRADLDRFAAGIEILDEPAGSTYEIARDAAGITRVSRVVDADGFDTTIRYDEHAVVTPAIDSDAVLTVGQALALLREVRPIKPPRRTAPPPTLDIVAPEDDGGTWAVVGYDLAFALGAIDNYEAQELVLDAVALADPMLRGRLDFDSESGMFEVTCDTEADARAVIDIIASIAPL